MIIVSSCLLGLKCRYDGQIKPYSHVETYLKGKQFIAVCPEQMGGLSTPRSPAEIVSQSPLVIKTEIGTDVTLAFINGVSEVGKLMSHYTIVKAILKSKSPSCGCHDIYDGTFKKQLVKGDGIFSQYLKKQNIEVMDENDIKLLVL